MKNKQVVWLLSTVIVFLLIVMIAGGMAFWRYQQTNAHGKGNGGSNGNAQQAEAGASAAASAAPTERREAEHGPYKYISLDKVIVMLRGKDGEPVSHYLAMDLVFKTREGQEKTVKDHLPLLRSVTVKSLSAYTMEKASLMTIDQFAADINRAFTESYKVEQHDKPFTEAMISKLIIE